MDFLNTCDINNIDDRSSENDDTVLHQYSDLLHAAAFVVFSDKNWHFPFLHFHPVPVTGAFYPQSTHRMRLVNLRIWF